jgi:hypothetical protein
VRLHGLKRLLSAADTANVPEADRQLQEVEARLDALETRLERAEAELGRLGARPDDARKASVVADLLEARRNAVHARARAAIAEL